MTGNIHNRLLQICLYFCGCFATFNSSNNFIYAKTDKATKLLHKYQIIDNSISISTDRNQTSNLSHSFVYESQKTQQVVVGLKPYGLLYQKKFGLSFSLVNAIQMFALGQNHKFVVYNPTDKNPTVVSIRNFTVTTYKRVQNRIQRHYIQKELLSNI